MKRFRFTIGQAMATVLFVGIGFAAMKNPNILWSSATYTLAILMISVASLVAIARQGRSRLPWAGFALFGGFALLAGALPGLNAGVPHVPSPTLLTRHTFIWFVTHVYYRGDDAIFQVQIFHSLEIIAYGFVGAFVGRLLALKDVESGAETPTNGGVP
jgi:hypothetical protein